MFLLISLLLVLSTAPDKMNFQNPLVIWLIYHTESIYFKKVHPSEHKDS